MDSNSAACWPCQGFSYFCFLPVDVCNRPASTPGHSGRKPYIYQWDEGESPSSPAEDIHREKQSLKLTLSPTVNRFSHYSNWLINIFKCLVLMFDASSREWHVIWSLFVITVIIIELLWFLFWSRSCWTCSQSQKTVGNSRRSVPYKTSFATRLNISREDEGRMKEASLSLHNSNRKRLCFPWLLSTRQWMNWNNCGN